MTKGPYQLALDPRAVPSAHLAHGLRKSLHVWIRRKQTLDFLSKRIAYRLFVAPAREGVGAVCRIVVRFGDRFWKAEGRGESVSRAFKRALDDLRPSEVETSVVPPRA